MPKPIYIDVCALSRPFDEQNYLRIRLETEAMNLILLKVREGKYKLLFSAVHIKEIEAISDVIERVELQMILDRLGEPIKADLAATRSRAEKLAFRFRHSRCCPCSLCRTARSTAYNL